MWSWLVLVARLPVHPRLADLGEAAFAHGCAGGLRLLEYDRPLAVNTQLIVRNWDDLLRVAGSRHQGG